LNPLLGRSVLILRPHKQAGDLAEQLAARGGRPIVVPAIEVLPPADWAQIDSALARLGDFDWIVFTSRNGVESVMSRIRATQVQPAPLPPNIAAIGPATEDAIEASGARATWIPTKFTTEAIASELPAALGQKVLLVRADIASKKLDEDLAARGLEVTRVDAYRTESSGASAIRQVLSQQHPDVVALTSASIAHSFMEAAGSFEAVGDCTIACIGPATAAACRHAGWPVHVESLTHTVSGLLDALTVHLGETSADAGD